MQKNRVFMMGLGLLLASVSFAMAQSAATKALPGTILQHKTSVRPPALANHLLKKTLFDSSSGGTGASCSTAGCISVVNVYTETVACPGAAGTFCTFDIRIENQASVSPAGEDGIYQFLIDGAIPNQGGTDGSGFEAWEIFGAGGQYNPAYSVRHQVLNSVSNQSHTITVNNGCAEVLGNAGCSGSSGFASLTINIYKP